MKTISIIKIHEVKDYETLNNQVLAFEDNENAKKEYNKILLQAKEMYADEMEEWECEESLTDFTIYPNGYYSKDHLDISLEIIELN